jgi:hypothetical protein
VGDEAAEIDTMEGSLLACGPYFAPGALPVTIALFLVVKPLAYYAFVKAYRFRVSREIPMSAGQAAKLAALRAVIGAVLIGGGSYLLVATGRSECLVLSWVYLYGARIAAWWIVGRAGAGLAGRRLFGWIAAGTMLNVLFDVAVVGGVFINAALAAAAVFVIGCVIAVLELSGRRDALRARFTADPTCATCGYNLTGNLSGICPECGTPVVISAITMALS